MCSAHRISLSCFRRGALVASRIVPSGPLGLFARRLRGPSPLRQWVLLAQHWSMVRPGGAPSFGYTCCRFASVAALVMLALCLVAGHIGGHGGALLASFWVRARRPLLVHASCTLMVLALQLRCMPSSARLARRFLPSNGASFEAEQL